MLGFQISNANVYNQSDWHSNQTQLENIINFIYSFHPFLIMNFSDFIVENGTAFGVDYLIYSQSTTHQHAEYLGIKSQDLNYQDLLGYLRLAKNSNKRLLIVSPDGSTTEASYANLR